MSILSVACDAQWLRVNYSDGACQKYYAAWLRDNVDTGRHSSQGQRTFDLNLMEEVYISEANPNQNQVTVRFNADSTEHRFDEAWLRSFSNDGPVLCEKPLWGAELQRRLRFYDFKAAAVDDTVLLDMLSHLDQYGFVLVEGVPCESEAIFSVVDLFGYVRQTNYGNLFDVRVEPNPANLAFTSGEIGMHTDNPYRNPVPGLQLLHCLVNDSDGGENQLVDGFNVAGKLRISDPADFKLLSSYAINFKYYEAGSADLGNRTPLISLCEDQVCEVRYNARSIQTFDLPVDEMEPYYRAYRAFGQALHQPDNRVEFRLQPGQLMIFDNQRVLHGRSSYQQGARHLQGCYADKDSLQSKLRVLEAAQ